MAKKPKSSEVLTAASPTDARTVEQIQKEYTGLAMQSGQLQYQLFTFQKDLDMINGKMRDLNLEAAAVKGRQTAAAAEAAKEANSNG